MKRFHLTVLVYGPGTPTGNRATRTIKYNVTATDSIHARREAIHVAWLNGVQVERFLQVKEVNVS